MIKTTSCEECINKNNSNLCNEKVCGKSNYFINFKEKSNLIDVEYKRKYRFNISKIICLCLFFLQCVVTLLSYSSGINNPFDFIGLIIIGLFTIVFCSFY